MLFIILRCSFFPGKIVVTKDSTCEMVHQTLTIITTALLLNLPPYHVRKTYFLPICNQIKLEQNMFKITSNPCFKHLQAKTEELQGTLDCLLYWS